MWKKIIIFIGIVFICFALNSCKTNDLVLSEGDYLVFGEFHGECRGEGCIEIFRLENGKLFEDTKDIYPNSKSFYVANYVQLNNEKYEAIKDLITYFPHDLLNEKSTVIGEPDAGDWGGFYIEYNFNGIHKMWLLDKMKTNVPAKYHEFIDQLDVKINSLE